MMRNIVSLKTFGFCIALVLIANGVAIWEAELAACQLNSCNHGCHYYNYYGSYNSDTQTYKCTYVPAGYAWDSVYEHTGAADPGGTWAPSELEVEFRVYESCCFMCLPSPDDNQKLEQVFNYQGSYWADKAICEQGGGS